MKLTRNHFHTTYTGGQLASRFFDDLLFTIEQEWRADPDHLGGTNNNSCVPNGSYELIPFIRPKNGLMVPQLVNPDLGVYKGENDVPEEGGRFLILIHPGNTVQDIVGCIASGMWKAKDNSVNDSRDAQMHVIQAFNEGDRELIIESFDTKEIYVPGAD